MKLTRSTCLIASLWLGVAACGDDSGSDGAPPASHPDAAVDASAQGATAGDTVGDTVGTDAAVADTGPSDVAAPDGADGAAEVLLDVAPLPPPPVCVGELCAADERHAPDPSTWGPFPVGVKTFEMDALGWEDKPRHFKVEVWYPATEEARGGPYEAIDLIADAPPEALALIGDFDVPPVVTHQVRDAALRLDGAPWPLVIFSHGAFGVRFQSVFFTTYLASHGYVVASPDHPENTVYDLVINGEYSPEAVGFNALDRPRDVSALIDLLLARNAADGDFFQGAMRPEDIGMSGHSFGGFTSFYMAFDDPRIRAIVPMAPATSFLFFFGFDLAELTTPTLLMAGGLDKTLDPEAEMWAAYEQLPPPKDYFDLVAGGHFTYSDICVLDLEKIADELGIPTGGALSDGCADFNVPPDLAHEIIRQFGVGFFNHHLRGSPDSRQWFDVEAAAAWAPHVELSHEGP